MSKPTLGVFTHQAELNLLVEPVTLLADRAMWLPKQRTLLLADLHIGKAMHFRKSGIAIPEQLAQVDLQRLDRLILQWRPKKVIFLGDLFHSQHNGEWDAFGMLITRYRKMKFILVRGNHDILEQAHYDQFGIEVVPDQLFCGSLLLTHDRLDTVPPGMYNLSGHVHPGFRLRGKGRQAMTMPCFHFGAHHGLLPAYGAFTGVMAVKTMPTDRVWVIFKDQLMEVPVPTQ
ncbi:MAG: ligase-associated DNA damage response endonuclease PdeM [Saprospiraceae bacterium]|nr:ligase-associated DNA damage response endonuclease PdeM [Saprospiraceae bacterium]